MVKEVHLYVMLSEILHSTSWQEWLAVIFGLIQVLLAYRNSPYNYLFGIANITFTLIILFQAGLFAEVSVNVYYLIMSIYGWWAWISKNMIREKKISQTTPRQHLFALGIVVISFSIIYYILNRHTHSDVAFWDSACAAFAYAGMYLLAKRKIENWLYLNVSNLIAIPLQYSKDLYLFGTLTFILFIIAIFGYFNWRKIYFIEKINSHKI